MVNRKLIRPSLADVSSTSKFASPGRKRVPPEQTHAENFYYVKQMNNQTPMIIRLVNGEELRGVIDWYDKDCIKVNRPGAPSLVIYKCNITYLFKEEEMPSRSTDSPEAPRPRARKRKVSEDADSGDSAE